MTGGGAKGISLICVEEGTPGFTKGRNLEKIGLHAQDTSELFFDDVRVPVGTCWARRTRASPTSSATCRRNGWSSPSARR